MPNANDYRGKGEGGNGEKLACFCFRYGVTTKVAKNIYIPPTTTSLQ